MYTILVTPDRAGRRVGEVHISQRSHDAMLHDLLTHPVRPLGIHQVTCCLKDRALTLQEAHDVAVTMAEAFWICWCDDPAQYSAKLQPCNNPIFAR